MTDTSYFLHQCFLDSLIPLKMIRLARSKALLTSSPQTFDKWCQLNDVSFHKIEIGAIPGKGTGLVASEQIENSDDGAECLLTVPSDLILSRERVIEHAKVDKDLRDVLEACGGLCQVS